MGQKAAFDKKIRELENQVRQAEAEVRSKNFEINEAYKAVEAIREDQKAYHHSHFNMKKAFRVLVHLGIEDGEVFNAKYMEISTKENHEKDFETIEDARQREQREKQIEQDNLRDRKLERKIQDIRDQDLDDDYGMEF